MTKVVMKSMTNINMVNIKYVDKTWLGEAFGVLLAALWGTLGTFRGPLRCPCPGGLGERLGGIFGTKCHKKIS